MKYGEVERSCLLTPAGFPLPLLWGSYWEHAMPLLKVVSSGCAGEFQLSH